MHKIWRLAVVVVGGLALSLAAVSGAKADTQDFSVKSLETDYYLSRDADKVAELRVHERIVVNIPNAFQNHGIFRYIPDTYDGHSIETTVQKVANEHGTNWHYESYTEADNLVLKIGNADEYLNIGDHVFEIDYTMRGVHLSTEGRQEFYWDVNGDGWYQTFDVVRARIHLSDDLAAELRPEKVCYTGAFGSAESFCSIGERDDNGDIVVATLGGLGANQTLTFSIAFNKDTFAAYKPSLALLTRLFTAAAVIIVPAVLALAIVITRWRQRGRDPKGKGVIIPQYLPLKDVSVLGSSAVLKEGFDTKAISATILDLAVRHYIKIYELVEEKLFKDKYNYEIELVKDPSDLMSEEKEVVDMLFGEAAAVGTKKSIEDLSKKLYSKAKKIGDSVDTKMTTLGYFASNPQKVKQPFTIIGSILLFACFFFSQWWSFGLLPAGLIFLIGAAAMPARTHKGVDLRDYLLGLKVYMELAEADRLKALQTPSGSLTEKINVDDKRQLIKLYERLLPYAMLFGIVEEWAKKFAGLYDEQPDWYSGHGAFSAAYFATAMTSIGTAANLAVTPPSSSGSGGFGGGGAGGGGGGGGGGGW